MSVPRSVVAKHEEPSDLSDNERAVLAALRDGAGTLVELAMRTKLNRLHTTRIFDALEKRGLILPP